MKTTIKFACIASAILAASCSNMEMPEMDSSILEKNSAQSHTFGDDGALEMADEFFGRSAKSRSGSPEILYIMNEDRSDLALPDTLAYVVNYPDNGGFVMLANDRRINPVLAYSETGNFNLESDVVNSVFVSRIADYMNATAPKEDAPNIVIPPMITYANVGPLLVIPMNQHGAFAKYVQQEYGNNDSIPAGCVPTAVAAIMLHAKDMVGFHDELINCAALRKPFLPLESEGGSTFPVYTQSSAIDKVAKIIWQVGKDLGTRYYKDKNGNWVGGTSMYPSLTCLKNLGYTLYSDSWSKYNFSDVYNLIAKNYIVLMDANYDEVSPGHAFVCDGCSYSVENVDGALLSYRYLHIAWLEINAKDGYYNGDVFRMYTNSKPGQTTYLTAHPGIYIGIKMESNSN